MCGPCQIESKQHSIDICGEMIEITKELSIPYIFKASFDKANRSSISGARGVGFDKGMETFDEIKKLYNNIPIVTDVHEAHQCAEVAKHVDMLQIPASSTIWRRCCSCCSSRNSVSPWVRLACW